MTSESAVTSGPKHPDESPSACTIDLERGKLLQAQEGSRPDLV